MGFETTFSSEHMCLSCYLHLPSHLTTHVILHYQNSSLGSIRYHLRPSYHWVQAERLYAWCRFPAADCLPLPATNVTNGVWPASCNKEPGSTCAAACDSGYSGDVVSRCSKGIWAAPVGSCAENGEQSWYPRNIVVGPALRPCSSFAQTVPLRQPIRCSMGLGPLSVQTASLGTTAQLHVLTASLGL